MEVKPKYNLTVKQEGRYAGLTYKQTNITYRAALGAGMRYSYLIIIMPLAFYLAYKWVGFSGWLSLCAPLFTFPMFYIAGFITVAIKNGFRTVQSIMIGEGKIIVGSKTYDVDHIKDAYSSRKRKTGSYTEWRHYHTARGAYYDDVSYKVFIEYGTKAIPIAKKLGELEAKELLEAICNLTGINLSYKY